MTDPAPCLRCADRHPLCWNDCEKYKALIGQKRAVSAARKKEAEVERGYIEARKRKKEK